MMTTRMIPHDTPLPRGTKITVNVQLYVEVEVDDDLLDEGETALTISEIEYRLAGSPRIRRVKDGVVTMERDTLPASDVYRRMTADRIEFHEADWPTYTIIVPGEFGRDDVPIHRPNSYVPRDVEWVDPFAPIAEQVA